MQNSSMNGARVAWVVLCLMVGCVTQRYDHAAPVGTASWQIEPGSVVADGQQAARVTLVVTRPSDAAWAGAQLRLLADDAHVLVSDVTRTEANGQARATIRCTEAGRFALRAEVLEHGLLWPLEGEATLLCLEVPKQPTSSAPIEPQTLAPDVLTNVEYADPGLPVRIAWVVYDATGHPLANKEVTLTTLRATDIISPKTAITDAQGRIQVTLVTQQPGDATVVAQVGAISVATVVQLGGTLPDPKFSRLVSRSGAALVAQEATADFDLEIRDRLNRPVPQALVELSSDMPTDVFSPQKGRTNEAGRWTATLTRTRAGLRQVTAAAPGFKLTTSVRFAMGLAHSAHSSMDVTPSPGTAEPTRPISVGVQLADESGFPVGGSPVMLSSSEPTDVFDTAAAQTNPNGRAVFSLRCRRAGVRTLTAQNPNIFILNTPLTVMAGEPNFALSQLVASPNHAMVGPAGAVALSSLWLDRFENPIMNQNVTWGGVQGYAFTNTITNTSSSGRTATTLYSTQAGPSQATATLQGQTIVADLTFQPGAPAQATSSLSLAANVLTADATPQGLVTVTLRDVYGNPVPQVLVSLSASGAAVSLNPDQAQTSALGAVTATVTSQVAGASSITAQAGPLTFTAPLSWVAGPAAAASSSLAATPNTVVANTVDTATLVAQFKDAYGNPIPNQTVTWSGALAPDALSATTQVTNASGVAQVTLSSSLARTVTITATLGGAAVQAPVNLVAGPAVAAQSSLVVHTNGLDPNVLVADNVSQATVTATLRDAYGNPVPNAAVSLSSSGAAVTFNPLQAQTSALGSITATVTSQEAGTALLTAMSGPVMLSAPLTLVAGPAAAAHSTLTASPNAVIANTVDSATLVARFADAFGNPIPNQTVTWSGAFTPDVLSATTQVTDASGVAQVTLASSLAHTVTITATLGSAGMQTPVQFVAGPAVFAQSSLNLTGNGQNTNVITADNVSQGVITVLLRDAYNNPVPNASVNLSSSGVAVTLYPLAAQTSALGVVTGTVTSQVAGASTLTAQASSLTLTAPLTWVAGPVAAASSSLAATPNTVVANTVDTATLVAHFADAFGNPIPSQTVTWSGATAPDVLSATTQVTNAAGIAQVMLASSLARSVTIVATLENVATQTPVTFVAGPAVAAHSSFLISPNALVIDGNTYADYALMLADAWSNPASAQSISVAAAEPNVTLIQPVAAGAGIFTGRVRSTMAGVKTLTATADSVVLQQPVTFRAGAVSASKSTLTATPQNGVWANGRSFLVLSAKLADAWNNPATARTIAFVSDSADVFAPALAVTDSAGAASTRVRASKEGAHMLSAQCEQVTLSVPANFARAAYVTTSTLVASPNSYVADSNTPISLNLTALDANGLPVQGAQVRWDAVAPNTSFSPSLGLTDAQGLSSSQMRGSRAGKQTAFAHITGLQIGAQVTAAPRSPRCSNTLYLNEAPWPIGPTQQRHVAAVDVNHDGNMDLVALGFVGTTTVNMGLGNKLFSDPVTYNVGPASTSFAMGDIDGDGQPDIIALSAAASRVYVRLGHSDGSFPALTSYVTGNSSEYMAVADLNGDGLTDVVTATRGDSAAIFVLTAQSGGILGSPARYSLPSASGGVATGPLVGPSQDIVVSLPNLNKIAVFSQTTSMVYGSPNFISVGMLPGPLVIDDFNGDGRADLAIGYQGERSCGIVFGQQDRSLSAYSSFPVPDILLALSSFDPSGSGAASIIASSPYTQSVYVYQNTSGSNFSLIETQPAGGQSRSPVAAVDVDGDGTIDFIVPNDASSKDLQIVYRTPSPQDTNRTFSQVTAMQALAADFNQDGHLDLFLVNYVGMHKLYYGRGDGGFNAPISITAGSQSTSGAVADFDNDGVPDAAVMNNDRTLNVFLRPSSSATTAATTLMTESTSISITSADVDDDGNQDILVANRQTDSISIYRGRGNGTFEAPQRYNVGREPRSIVAVDLNVDGLVDVAVADTVDGNVAILLNDGFGQLLAPTYVRPAWGTTHLAVGDFDSDGLMDLVTMSDTGINPIEILYNRRDSFSVQSVTDKVEYMGYLSTGDLDGDGRLDLIVSLRGSNAVRVFINRGDSSFGTGRNYSSTGITPTFVSAADFTERGQDSVFVYNSVTHDATLLRQIDCR